MSELPQYSVVMPAYNAAETITRSVESILEQTVPAGEIIIVNDGSTDETCQVLEKYSNRITLVTQENGGPAAARNNGIHRAKHEWVALLDSDDTWLPGKMERQLQECAADVGLIHCSELQDVVDYGETGLNFDRLWIRNDIGTSTVMLNKAAFTEVGGFKEEPELIGVEDYNLWLRILHAGYRIATVSEPLVNYTPAEGNISSNAERVVKAELYNVMLLENELDLSPELLRIKRNSIYQEYATTFFWRRNLPLARHYYGKMLRQSINLKHLGYWAATYLPASLLDFLRSAPA